MIRDVWAYNFESELKLISELLTDYPFVGMDTEFPGNVAFPAGEFSTIETLEYQVMRCNVDLLKIIQIGITLTNDKGETPVPYSTWQFNFSFSLKQDAYYGRAITLLRESGIDFDKFESEGIDVFMFAKSLFGSGLVMNPDVKWLTFHSISDFGYLFKILTCKPLPESEAKFLCDLSVYFPVFYDIKYFTSAKTNIANGLQGIAEQLHVIRIGKEHQAGSDSFVTSKVFFALNEKVYNGGLAQMGFENKLYGVVPYLAQNTR